jgi:single-stranded-DNA-specific exonuclease
MALVIAPRLEWLLPEPFPSPPEFVGFGRPIATLLARRGFADDLQLRRFLDAGAGALHDVSLMADADAALARLDAALQAGERIAIWGDYDADGMTAIAVWMIALRALGAEPLRYVPSRLAEGYGLSERGLADLASRDVTLVVTCDCGISNVAEVDYARGLGIDVIVTDHHLPPAVLPRAVAVVDPHRIDCRYPDEDLTGAGVAFKLANALLTVHGLAAANLAAMAAIGTVADMAPMTGESRAIVRLGLRELAETSHAGLRALLARSADDPAQPTARDLGYGVAPRINAAGRIAEAELAICLLLEEDPTQADALASQLEEVHLRRRELTLVAVDEATASVADPASDGPLVVRGDWAPGLIGLVAGRLCDALARPVAVVTDVGGELRGSVRAPVDFHVAAALEACAEHLTKRGGHAAAGGFSIAAGAFEAFSAAFEALGGAFPEPLLPTPRASVGIAIDLVLTAGYLGWPLADELARLAPYGPGHVEPILAVTGLQVVEARRVGASADHVLLRMRRGAEIFDAIAFGTPPERGIPEPGVALDLVCTLERDLYQGIPRLRLRTLDYADAASSPLMARRLAATSQIVAPLAVAGAA